VVSNYLGTQSTFKESTRRGRDSRAPPAEGDADGGDARFVSVTNRCEIVTDNELS